MQVDELRENAPECLIFLAGTKADLIEAGVPREASDQELTKVCEVRSILLLCRLRVFVLRYATRVCARGWFDMGWVLLS